jgi:hypothetical protein
MGFIASPEGGCGGGPRWQLVVPGGSFDLDYSAVQWSGWLTCSTLHVLHYFLLLLLLMLVWESKY